GGEVREFMGAISRRLPFARDEGAVTERALLAGFVDAARRAGSHAEAMQLALDTVREQLGATSVMLLDRSTGTDFVCTSASPSSSRLVGSIPGARWLARRLRVFRPALPMTSSDLDAAASWSAAHRPDAADEIAWLIGAKARAVLALRAREDVIGMLILGPAAGDAAGYDPPARAALGAIAGELALMIE